MARKPLFNEFVDSLGLERYYMDGELSRAQAAKYWRDVYNRRYSSVSMRSRTIKTAAKGNVWGQRNILTPIPLFYSKNTRIFESL